ncbi:glutamine ABC transporter substrate-binding protein [Oceanisphaera profunda]|uniref:Glutamine ABC transporter substrate-binding protein n=1 Tax=Oceanisphaera profunda TaxID=1416627 RepID=A0A1Y0D697_9GAMM|nr:transporter substrate-binding domain-containing protein [Oceanisphaera profunda]ART82696.1 glutamine ABC transporter substrate-binding protein [Oceanisphaera profunda]
MKKNVVLLSLVAALGLTACDKPETQATSSAAATPDKVYKVGVDNTYPPFEFTKDGQLVGIDVDLINAIAKDQGFKINIEQMDFSGIIPAMQAGMLDVGMGGMSITDKRKETVDFSEPYFAAGVSLVVANDNKNIASLDDLSGKKVVVKNGTVGASFADKNTEEYGYSIIQVSDSASMFQEVTNGTADALMEDYPVISYAIATGGLKLQTVGERLTGDNYGISVLKDKNDELLKMINDGLANLKENGEYDKIIDAYLD